MTEQEANDRGDILIKRYDEILVRIQEICGYTKESIIDIKMDELENLALEIFDLLNELDSILKEYNRFAQYLIVTDQERKTEEYFSMIDRMKVTLSDCFTDERK